jgi:hypothetical protein
MSPVSNSGRSAGMKLTYDDFVLFPDDGKRHELIDGEHYVTASPNTKHQQVTIELVFLIRSWLENHPVGRLFTAPYDVELRDHDHAASARRSRAGCRNRLAEHAAA